MTEKPLLRCLVVGFALATVFFVGAASPVFFSLGFSSGFLWVAFLLPTLVLPDSLGGLLGGLLPGSGIDPRITLAPYLFISFVAWWLVFTVLRYLFVRWRNKPNNFLEPTP